MEGFVQVMSREIIKPSSQTCLHPRELKLSVIDKWINYCYIPLIFFYEADESRGLTTSNHLQISQRFKHSLLDTVPSFYPLSGRFKSKLSVDCNDAGVEFVVARVRGQLKHAISMDHDQLKQYLPSECTAPFDHGQRPRRPLLVVQITFFGCGGLAVGVCVSHTVADLASAMTFVNAWAAAYGGEAAETSHITFGTTKYLPSFSPTPLFKFQRFFISDEKFVTKKFVFDEEKLDILRRIATSPSESTVKDPSRVELVSAFIWKQLIAARLNKGKAKTTYAALHAVNMRPRTSPPRLLENVFGNCLGLAMAFSKRHASPEDLHLHGMIARLRSSIRRAGDDDYVRKPLRKGSLMKSVLKMAALIMMGKVEWCVFSSWRGFPTYELDYGWGKPVWFTTPGMPMKNMVVLVSSKGGDEVEAIVTMMPDDIQFLDAQINNPHCLDI